MANKTQGYGRIIDPAIGVSTPLDLQQVQLLKNIVLTIQEQLHTFSFHQ
jgi:hypothetical protein